MAWHLHRQTHNNAYSWLSRSDLTPHQQSSLQYRSTLNYYGFWVNKPMHGGLVYALYKKGFFTKCTEAHFWLRTIGVTVFIITSTIKVDYWLRFQLAAYCEDLRHQYGSERDRLRREYQTNKNDLKMQKEAELSRLAEQGKDVMQLTSNRGAKKEI